MNTDIVGIATIAERMGVSRSAVRKWMAHDDWPGPQGYLSTVQQGPGSTPWWSWSTDIAPFLQRHPLIGANHAAD